MNFAGAHFQGVFSSLLCIHLENISDDACLDGEAAETEFSDYSLKSECIFSLTFSRFFPTLKIFR